MLPRIYNICQRNVNPCVVFCSKFCTYSELPVSHKIGKEKDAYDSVNEEKKSKVQIITCKNKKFNYHKGQTFPKFLPLPLASEGWSSSKSKGDFFTIHPVKEEINEMEASMNVTFKDLGLSDELIANLKNTCQIEKPTEIQIKGIPKILDYQNVKLLAETGCGKTLAYLLPLVDQVLNWKTKVNRTVNQPLALIITPSRELALQIGRAAMYLTKGLDIKTKIVVGGSVTGKIFNPPATDVDIMVGTIGAISKVRTIGIYKMKFVRHVVLDEADSLFDETFFDKLRRFLLKISFGPLRTFENGLPKYSQLSLVSATMPQFIDEILDNIVDPSSLEEVSTDRVHRVFVTQKFFRVGMQQKPMTLLKLIKSKAQNKTWIIIFCNDSKTCDWLSQFLNEFEVKNIRLNGKMPVFERKNKFNEFQTGMCNVLCTTDAGSRGLDTIMVTDVINYDFPLQTSEYIHRCGRTARVGSPRNCRVINFIARPWEIILTKKIEKAIKLDKRLPMSDYLKQNWTMDKEDEKAYKLEILERERNAKEKFTYFSDESSKKSNSFVSKDKDYENEEVNEKILENRY